MSAFGDRGYRDKIALERSYENVPGDRGGERDEKTGDHLASAVVGTLAERRSSASPSAKNVDKSRRKSGAFPLGEKRQIVRASAIAVRRASPPQNERSAAGRCRGTIDLDPEIERLAVQLRYFRRMITYR